MGSSSFRRTRRPSRRTTILSRATLRRRAPAPSASWGTRRGTRNKRAGRTESPRSKGTPTGCGAGWSLSSRPRSVPWAHLCGQGGAPARLLSDEAVPVVGPPWQFHRDGLARRRQQLARHAGAGFARATLLGGHFWRYLADQYALAGTTTKKPAGKPNGVLDLLSKRRADEGTDIFASVFLAAQDPALANLDMYHLLSNVTESSVRVCSRKFGIKRGSNHEASSPWSRSIVERRLTKRSSSRKTRSTR